MQTPRFFLFQLGQAIDSDSTRKVQVLVDVDEVTDDYVTHVIELAKADLVTDAQTAGNEFEALGQMFAVNLIDSMTEGLKVQISNQIKDGIDSTLEAVEQPTTWYLVTQSIQKTGRNTAIATITRPEGTGWESPLESVDFELRKIDGSWQIVGLGDRTIEEAYQSQQSASISGSLEAAQLERRLDEIEARQQDRLTEIEIAASQRRAETAQQRLEYLQQEQWQLEQEFQQAVSGTSNSQFNSTSIDSTVGQQVTLVADSSAARINLRDEPRANLPTRRYGLVGDQVLIQDSTTGEDGYIWYNVQFEESGAIGWIRGDFVSVDEEY
ncbi:hypothetical protein H6G00_13745 [Leptolyngbya sp. FACHB-541]|nr:hypothetical protein [Leptolyngbya sp. FACHB-541]